ncbi:MAG: ABC transporter permease [Spirochaetia bacterium]
MNTIRMALRNLNRQKKRTFLLGGAIAFGILIITMINGFTGSFVENVGENFSHLLAGHIFIDGVEKTEEGEPVSIIRDDTRLVETIEELDVPVRFLTKRSDFNGVLIFQGETLSQNIVGADWQKENYLTERLVLVEGSFENMRDETGIIISKEVADALNVQLGERILVRLRTARRQQNVGDFTVVAISHDPGLFGSISAYANLEYVNRLLDLDPAEYMTLGIFLEDFTAIDREADRLYRALREKVDVFDREARRKEDQNPLAALFRQAEEETWSGTRYRLMTLNDALEEVQQIVRILDNAGLIIMLILFIIIMVGITNTFRMIIFERIKEIGTMRALGMHRNGVRRLFLLEAVLLSVGGIIAGFILSGIAMLILSNIFWGLESPIYILLKNGYMTFRPGAGRVIINIALVLGLTLLAAFFPTRKAARLEPVDALRA